MAKKANLERVGRGADVIEILQKAIVKTDKFRLSFSNLSLFFLHNQHKISFCLGGDTLYLPARERGAFEALARGNDVSGLEGSKGEESPNRGEAKEGDDTL